MRHTDRFYIAFVYVVGLADYFDNRLVCSESPTRLKVRPGQKRSLAGNDAYTSRGEIHAGNDFVTFSLLLPFFPQPITYSYAPVSIPLICNTCELLLH